MLIDRFDLNAFQSAVTTHELQDAVARSCMEGSYPSIDAARWKQMQAAIADVDADHGLFLQLDSVQLSLALRRRVANDATVSGILFKPTVHYREAPSVRAWLRDIRKSVLYRAMMLHPDLSTVFSLDPYFATFAQEHFHRGDITRFLPDPVPADSSAAEHPPPGFWTRNRVVFLLFGYLSRRKGLLTLMEAVTHLPPSHQARTSVILAGSFEPEIKQEFDRLLRLVQKNAPDLHIRIVDRFIEQQELSDWVSHADVVLAPYQNAVGSSGVVLWAAMKQTPLLTQSYGLIGRYVNEYGLGKTVDTTDPQAIAQSMSDFIQVHASNRARAPSDNDFEDAKRSFLERHSPDNFGRVLLEELSTG